MITINKLILEEKCSCGKKKRKKLKQLGMMSENVNEGKCSACGGKLKKKKKGNKFIIKDDTGISHIN